MRVSNFKSQNIDCSFLLANSGFAPMKVKSLAIPKLEIKLPVLDVRLKEISIEQQLFY